LISKPTLRPDSGRGNQAKGKDMTEREMEKMLDEVFGKFWGEWD